MMEALAARTYAGAHGPVPYTLRTSTRARWVSASARPQTGIVVTAALQTPAATVETFLRRYERWLSRQTAWLKTWEGRIPHRWPFGATLPYLGVEHAVEVEPGLRDEVEPPREGRWRIRARRRDSASVRRLLKRWYMDQAEAWCAARAALWARRLGVDVWRVRVGDQRSRWGSCSATGALTFNFRLVMMPLPVLDYVVVHELCHRQYLCHHPHFWRLLSRHQPDYRSSIDWLRLHGAWLW